MPITIASLDEALTIAQNFDYIISLTDPSQRMKSFGDNHIHVKFPDTTHPTDLEYMKMYSGVLQVINWVKRNKLTPEHKILVHCHAGISRSSAMAWTLKVMFGETDYREAFNSLKENRTYIWPNTQVIAFADEILGLEGKFSQVGKDVDAEIAVERTSPYLRFF